MKEQQNLLYYSVNSFLSYRINSTFYKHFHYVWCAPVYDSKRLDDYHQWYTIPPSSNPFHIYKRYIEDVKSEDLHCPKIKENNSGLLIGATAKLQAGVINEVDFARINEIIKRASILDYRPLIYLIPAHKVKDRIKLVEVAKSANPLSTEYLLCDLSKDEFEIIEPCKL